ncbi:MAG: glycosyltransferase family 39 protein [Candidatus Omnitrophica bacterium]|nr:glycosyltransferase family 39 protein [Candidatus Omnitrophota bacterium]
MTKKLMNRCFLIYKKYAVEILLSMLIVFLFLTHLYWIFHNDLLIYEVNQEHTPKALFYYKHLSVSLEDFFRAFTDIRSDSSYWPPVRSPLLYIITGLFACLTGFSVYKAQLSFFIFFLLLIIPTYLIASKIADKKTGLLAVVFTALNPLIFHYSHIYNQDFPLAAMVSLGFYFLMFCADFRSAKYSVFLGIIFGLGVLTKPIFIVYLLIPLLFCLRKYLAGFDKKHLLKAQNAGCETSLNIALFFVIFVSLASAWYGYKLKWILPNCHYEFFINKISGGHKNKILFYAVEYYEQCGLLAVLIFCSAVFGFCKFANKYKKLLLSWLIFSQVFLMMISNQQIRFALPVIPAIAIFSAIGITQGGKHPFKKYIYSIIIVLLFCQFIYLSFFPKITTGSLAGINNFIFAKWNSPPCRYWNTVEGKKYMAFFDEIFKENGSRGGVCKEIAEYHNYLRYVIINDNSGCNSPFKSFKEIFKQYLLFKKPYLLTQSLSDQELALLFISFEKDEKEIISRERLINRLRIEKLRDLQLLCDFSLNLKG